MKHKWAFTGAILATLVIGTMLGACVTSAGANTPPSPAASTTSATPSPSASPTPAEETTEYTSPIGFGRRGINKYTKADYELAMSFKVNGWQDMSVADFNAKLLNVSDESSYHKSEDALLRVIWTLDEKDSNADFLLGPLRTSIYECRTKHYSACAYDKLPSWDGYVEYAKYADVFGDQVQIASSYADYNFRYRFSNESTVTVAQREAFLQNVEKGMQTFLDKQTEDDLKKEAVMEKALTAELVRLAKEQGGDAITAEGCGANYYWENFYD